MNLGLLTRGLCSSILKFVRSINPLIHNSFGDSDDLELPHITGPLWSMSDRIVITPPGEEPPQLGHSLPEDEKRRAARRSNPFHTEEVDLDSIYSFSTNTENIELCDWTMVNVPLMKQFDLHTFWSDADIRLVAYSAPLDNESSQIASKQQKLIGPKYHKQKENEYFLCVELQHLSNHPGREPNDGSQIHGSDSFSDQVDSVGNIDGNTTTQTGSYFNFKTDETGSPSYVWLYMYTYMFSHFLHVYRWV